MPLRKALPLPRCRPVIDRRGGPGAAGLHPQARGGAGQAALLGTGAPVWRAIWSSSCEGSTRTEQRDAASLIGLVVKRLSAASRLTPNQARPLQIAARTGASFSPIPPVKTSMSNARRLG